MEQVWDAANLWQDPVGPAGPARRALIQLGGFAGNGPAAGPAWDHLGYSFVLENTRAVQIIRRVVRELRAGEGLGIPSIATMRWLDATEAIVFGAPNLFSAWLSTSTVRQDPESVRRNAYWRLFGMDLAFGTDDNRPFVFDKAVAANASFVPLFEELLYELWQALSNLRNTSGANQADDDRIFRIAEQLGYILRVRRQKALIAREELAAATALGWIELSLSANTPVVVDLRAEATSAADRLRLIGERVGLAPHSRSGAFFAMAGDLSLLLRTLEAGYVSGPEFAWLLYSEQSPAAPPLPPGAAPLGAESRRVITEWSAATGKDLKRIPRPVWVDSRPPALSR
jgi:predicted ATPase